MLPIFTYGTLMYQPLWLKIAEHQRLPIPAVTKGFARCSIENSLSCSLVAAAGGHVAGMLYGGLSESEIVRLDEYTASLFERVQLQVVTPNETIVAYSYVIKPEFESRILPKTWNQRRFEHFGLLRLLANPGTDLAATA